MSTFDCTDNAIQNDRADEVRPPRRLTITRRRLLAAGSLAAGLTIAHRRPVFAGDEEDLVSDILRSLSLEKRIAQMFVFQAQGVQMTPGFLDLLEQVRPGGIVFVAPNIGNPAQIETFVDAIHRSNSKLPPLIAIDQEGGDVIRLPNDPAPGATVLGRLPDADVRSKSKDRGKFLARFGFDVNFAPVADIAYANSSTMYFRSFGSDPNVVANKVSAVVRGSRAVRVMGAAKHFPGHGRTATDSHYAIPKVDLTTKEWKRTDALPFQAAIDAGVEMVMAGHLKYSKWDDQPASLSKVAVDVLRHDLGFNGVIVTDDLSMGALAGMSPHNVVDRAIDAGMDMLLYTVTSILPANLVDHVANRVRADDVSKRRIDASVRRILRTKIRHFELSGKDER